MKLYNFRYTYAFFVVQWLSGKMRCYFPRKPRPEEAHVNGIDYIKYLGGLFVGRHPWILNLIDVQVTVAGRRGSGKKRRPAHS